MIDIYIDKVSMKNVRCHSEMEFDFPMNSFTCILGKNGAGKSTIPKSISMALFGDDGATKGDRLGVADMINDKVCKDMEIILNFRMIENGVTDKYTVQLYHEHKKFRNKLVLLKNGIDISGKSKTETYEFIEKLLVSRDVYHNIVYYSQNVKDFFTALTNSEQKQIFDAILDTGDYNKYYSNTSIVLKGLISEIQALEVQMTEVGTLIKVKREQTLANLVSSRDSAIKSNDKMIADLDIQRISKENELQILSDNKDESSFNQSQLDKFKSDLSTLIEKKDSKEKNRQDQISKLSEQDSIELNNHLLKIQNNESEEIGKIKTEGIESERLLTKKIEEFYPLISELDTKYSTSESQLKYHNFSTEKRKEIVFINNEIAGLDNLYPTETLESELANRLSIFSKNSSDIKDKATKIKEAAATIKSSISEKEKTIKEDEDKLNQAVPTCSKCLRPFIGDGGNIIKDSVEKLKLEVVELQSQISEFKTQMESLKSENDSLEIEKTKCETDYKEKIKIVLEKKKQQSDILIRKRNLIESEISDYKIQIDNEIQGILNEKNKALQEINSKKSVIEDEIKKIQSDIQSKIKVSSQKFTIESDKIKSEHIKKYTSLRSEIQRNFDAELKELTDSINRINLNITSLENQKSNFENIKHDIEVVIVELKTINNRIKECRELKYDDNQIKKVTAEIEEHEKVLLSTISMKNSINREIKILEFWKDSFSESGIRSMLIDMAIPHMNESVARALDIVAPGVFTVSFDTLKMTKAGDMKDKFNVNIRHNIKGTNSYKKLSGGERRLIDLCCMEALRSLSERLYGKRFHNIFYDEVLDSLDDDSCQAFGQASRTLITDKNITLITHKVTENIEPDRVFTL